MDGIGGVGVAGRINSGAGRDASRAVDAEPGAGEFGALLAQLGAVSNGADTAMADLATGGNVDLHDVVLSVQMESIAFDLAVQIRNRLVDAYSEIFRMQI